MRAKGGEALFLDDFQQHVPSMVVNSFGKGKGVYLNFSAETAAADPDSFQAKAVTSAVGEILAFLGVRPLMKVTGADGEPLRHAELFHYRVPGVDYYALLREDAGSKQLVGYDGIVRAGEAVEGAAETVSITLPREGHVYDALAKRHLGECSTFSAEVGPAEAKVFAVYPHEIRDLAVLIEGTGNRVDYEAQVIVGGTAGGSARAAMDGKPREHVVIVEAVDPAGRVNPLYSGNVRAPRGRARGTILFSLEGEGGPWTLRFTEAASGITKSVEVIMP